MSAPAADATSVPVPPVASVWRRFRQHPLARVGVAVLGLFIALAIIGPLALPDDSPHANRQQLALARLPAGSSAVLLRLPYADPPLGSSFLDAWWNGRPASAREIPLSMGAQPYEVKLSSDSLRVRPAIGPPLAFARPAGLAADQLIVHRSYPLGTDALGRCLYSRLVLGARVTLSIGLLAVLLSIGIGTFVGLVAGYFGGRLDRVLQGTMTVVWALPALLLAVAIAFVMGKGYGQLVWAVGLSLWVDVARIVRGEVRSLRERAYVEAAVVMGFGHARILFHHILPALTGPLVILAASNFASAVLLESGLSFLGLGVPPPTPSWGAMIQEGYPYLLIDRGRGLALWPAATLFACILAIYFVGQGLRDAADPRRA